MTLTKLINDIAGCQRCANTFDHSPRPVLQLSPSSKILIAGQAPGSKVHASGIPFDDASGDRLRLWMGIDKATFYNPHNVAIVPMAFCYPGQGKSGDLPPPSICATTWREQTLALLSNVELTLLVGQHAQKWHLQRVVDDTDNTSAKNEHLNEQSLSRAPARTLTEQVRNNDWSAGIIALPHPSPRNNIWLKKNPWFETTELPKLATTVHKALQRHY